jgi:hypothetical protein
MTWKSHVLVVAAVTADSGELIDELAQRATAAPTSFTIVVPQQSVGVSGREEAERRLDSALSRARERGLEVEGQLGDSDPMIAVSEAFDPRRFDEIVVSTLPAGTSHWLRADLPQRVAKLTGLPVQHVVVSVPRPHPVAGPVPLRLTHASDLLGPTPAWSGGPMVKRGRSVEAPRIAGERSA